MQDKRTLEDASSLSYGVKSMVHGLEQRKYLNRVSCTRPRGEASQIRKPATNLRRVSDTNE